MDGDDADRARRLFRRALHERKVIHLDDAGARIDYPDQDMSVSLTWDEIREVSVYTMHRPLARADVFVMLRGPGGRALPMLSHETPLELLAELERLPGFDPDKVADAMIASGSADKRMLCWSRDDPATHRAGGTARPRRKRKHRGP